MATTKSFSLYLAKQSVTKSDDLLTEKALDLVKRQKAHRISSSKFGGGAVLFTFPGLSYSPKWVELLATTFAVPDDLYTQSPCAILTFEKDSHSDFLDGCAQRFAGLPAHVCEIASNCGSDSLLVQSLLRLVLGDGLGWLGLNTFDDEAC